MLNYIIIGVALALGGYLAFSPRLSGSSAWKATVTPLGSIMGSGFLVVAPLLAGIVGYYAIAFMAILLTIAYGVGGVIRFNIEHFEPIEQNNPGPPQIIGFLSRVVLAGAYFISVTYYLQLLAAFVGNAFGVTNNTILDTITSSLLIAIASVGMWRGLGMLEYVEKYAISLNLGMIGGLLVALVIHNAQLASGGTWSLPNVTATFDFHNIRVLLGLLIVVQGFETSRYLGDEHPAAERIQTMRWAQWIASLIYIVFLGLITVQFRSGLDSDVTAIVRMTRPIAVVLPILISVAAIGSQFSAAVADAEGAGGLLEDITHRRLPMRVAYFLILMVTLALTWETNVNVIIAYASRAFALFYTLQCAVGWIIVWRDKRFGKRRRRLVIFGFLAVMCLVIFLLGLPSG